VNAKILDVKVAEDMGPLHEKLERKAEGKKPMNETKIFKMYPG